MPLILGTNSIKDTGYDVANSLRFNDGSSDNLTRTPSSSGNRKTFTISFWIKRSTVGTSQFVFNARSSDAGAIFFTTGDQLYISFENVTGGQLQTNRVFRDVSAWYHIVYKIDTTQGTSSNRMKLYVNGVQETSFATESYPNQDVDTRFNENIEHTFGQRIETNGDYFDGYLSEFVMVDGTQLDPTSFGEFDEDSGIWKPIDVSGLTFGTNGFYLDFEDSSALGDDVSGNGNDFTVNNLTAADQATDTCTNNFCTMNPLIPTTNATFSEGNCKLAIGGSSIQGAGIGTFGLTAGKWYFEVKLLADKDNHTHGAISELTAELNANVTAIQNDVGVTSWINGDGGEVVVDGTATTADYGIMAENSIMGIALDIDNYNITYLDDNSALVSNFNMSSTRGAIFPLIKMGINCTAEVNFGGCSAFAVSSGNTDANGYGNFEHAPPSGYFAICTKNLAEYG